MKKKFKKRIIITGGSGLLGSYFYKKYSKKFVIIKYPYRIENFKKLDNWIENKDFEYFIHFAAITKNESKKFSKTLNLINVKSSINILKTLKKVKIKSFKYFLFISSSHVYGYSSKIIKENKLRKPKSPYGKSKKKVEDFIFRNRKKFNYKIGVARIFNSTGPKQKKGNFVPDMILKMKRFDTLFNINQNRDFIHIDDVSRSIIILLKKEFEKPINISSGRKINLIKICKILNQIHIKKKINFDLKKGKDIYGDNSLLRKIGIRNLKDIKKTLSTYRS